MNKTQKIINYAKMVNADYQNKWVAYESAKELYKDQINVFANIGEYQQFIKELSEALEL